MKGKHWEEWPPKSKPQSKGVPEHLGPGQVWVA